MSKPRVVEVIPVLDTNAYSDNDVLFVAIEVPSFFREKGGGALLHSVTVLDAADQNIGFELFFASATHTLGTLNAAITVSDADAAKITGNLLFTSADMSDTINSRLYCKRGVGLVLGAAADSTSLWLSGAVRGGTPTYAAASFTIKLGIADQ